MKGILIGALTTLMVIFGFGGASAQDTKAKYTAQQVYDFFEQYSPQDVVDHARKAVEHFSKMSQKAATMTKNEEEEMFDKSLKEFHKIPLKFKWEKYPLIPFIVPQRCDEGRVVAHPITVFFKMMNEKGFINKYRDVKGKKIGLSLCEKVKNSELAAWGMQYQWWPQTDKPLNMGALMIAIPNSPYQVQAFYPTQKYSEEQLNALLK